MALSGTKKGLSASTLKTIAIIAMAIDHTSVAFFSDFSTIGMVMRFIGRITGPVMFYMIAEGYFHTRDVNKYTLRLALFAAVSYLPFIYFESGSLPNSQNFLKLNVFYTLCLGLLALRAWCEIKQPVLRIVVVAGLMAASSIGDWGVVGVAIILVFGIFRGDFKKQAIGYALIVGANLIQPATLLLWAADTGVLDTYLPSILQYGFIICGMFIPLILLRFYNGEKGNGYKWLFYIFYPAHLVLLGFLKFGVLGLA